MSKKCDNKRKANGDAAEEAPATKKRATTSAKPKTLLAAVVAAVSDLGGNLSPENAVSLPAL